MNQEQVLEFATKYGYKPNGAKKAFNDIHTILFEDESLKAILEGLLDKISGRRISGTGIVILSNKRIIFYRKSFIGTITREEIPIGKITSISMRKGFLSAPKMCIKSANDESIVMVSDHNLLNKFINDVQNLIN